MPSGGTCKREDHDDRGDTRKRSMPEKRWAAADHTFAQVTCVILRPIPVEENLFSLVAVLAAALV